MSCRFTIGIEEEFQTVHYQTGEMISCIHPLLERVSPVFGKRVKTELLQPTIELASEVYPDIHAARSDLYSQRAQLARLVNEQQVGLMSAGTHPSALWQEQKRTEGEHYAEQEMEEQDVGRSLLIFGLHIHIGVENDELALLILQQMRLWIPHLLALSSNSPFWAGRFTGLKSYRTALWGQCPRSGIPPLLPSHLAFTRYVEKLVGTGCIRDGRGIWWDIRPHPHFHTVEIRVFDMPATIEDTLALAALSQALVAKLAWLNKHDKPVVILPGEYIEENRWRAMRYGLDAEIVDFVADRKLSMRSALHELLDFVEDPIDDLGSQREMQYLRDLLDGPDGTGADRQIAAFQKTKKVQEVIQLLMDLTLDGVQASHHSL